MCLPSEAASRYSAFIFHLASVREPQIETAKIHPHILSGKYIPDCTNCAVKQKKKLFFFLREQGKEKQQPNPTGPLIAFLFF